MIVAFAVEVKQIFYQMLIKIAQILVFERLFLIAASYALEGDLIISLILIRIAMGIVLEKLLLINVEHALEVIQG